MGPVFDSRLMQTFRFSFLWWPLVIYIFHLRQGSPLALASFLLLTKGESGGLRVSLMMKQCVAFLLVLILCVFSLPGSVRLTASLSSTLLLSTICPSHLTYGLLFCPV